MYSNTKMDVSSKKDEIVHKNTHIVNPNYASMRCTQPLPTVINLQSENKLNDIVDDDVISNDCSFNANHTSVKTSSSQPLMLTNHTYDHHCFSKSDTSNCLTNQNSHGTGNQYNEENSNTSNNALRTSKRNMADTESAMPQSNAKPLGIFQYMKFERCEGDEDVIIQQHVSHENLTTKEKLNHILHSKPVHISIIVLVVLDCIFVIFELLIDLKVIKFEEGNPLPSILHGFSIAILSVFMVEIGAKLLYQHIFCKLCTKDYIRTKLYADYRHFIRHKVEVLDAVVVVISFGVDVGLAFFEESALAALSLLILLRLWRIFRIINGMIVAIKTKADERVHEIKEKNQKLENHLQEAEEKLHMQTDEIKRLRNLLLQNGIPLKGVCESSSAGTYDGLSKETSQA